MRIRPWHNKRIKETIVNDVYKELTLLRRMFVLTLTNACHKTKVR